MIIRHQKYFAQGILFMLLATFVLIPEGTLLCFGEQGHKALEFVERCINSNSGPQYTSLFEPHISKDDCGPCLDIPSPDNIITKDIQQQIMNPSLFVILWATPFMLPEISLGQLQPFNIARHDLNLKSLHATILRI